MKFLKGFVCFIVILLIMTISPYTMANGVSGQWVLVDVIDHENLEYWDSSNKSDSYQYDHIYSRGSYTITTTYLGATDTYYTPPYIHGEAFAYQAKWSLPPATFKAGDVVSLKVSVSVALNTQSAFKGSGGTRAYWGNSNITNANGKYFYEVYWSSDASKNYKALSDTVSFVASSGSEGAKKSIWLSTGQMDTEFVYEWSSVKKPVDPKTFNLNIAPEQQPTTEPATEPVQQLNSRVDSGVRFSNLYGEVSIKRSGDEDDGYEYAELDMVIYQGDVIRVKEGSGLILSMPDMSTFKMDSEGLLVVNTDSEKENKLKLLAGKIYANVKKIIQTGEMEVEMSQAVLGIKGTTFIIEETGSTSTVKVLEGSVEMTSIKSGKSVLVHAGNSAHVTNGADPLLSAISIKSEAELWKKTLIELQLNNAYMLINGEKVEIDPGRGTVPALVSNRTMIPISSVIKAMGGTVDYQADTQKITLKLGTKTLEMWLNQKEIKLDGKTLIMDVAPISINGRTMVPIKFVAENFSFDVDWHAVDKKIIIQ